MYVIIDEHGIPYHKDTVSRDMLYLANLGRIQVLDITGDITREFIDGDWQPLQDYDTACEQLLGWYIYMIRTDSNGEDEGKYVQPSRKVFPTRKMARLRAEQASPSRDPIVVKLRRPVPVDHNLYPLKEGN
jgi:hypothetical protein